MTAPRSSLARMQQVITLVLTACAIGWLAWYRESATWLAFGGFASILVTYSGFLALELFALRVVNRGDPTPQASCRQLLRAWLGEILQAPRVFCWRQPFWWNEFPDRLSSIPALRGHRGVVFIHGFVCNRGFWTPWLRRLNDHRRAFAAVNLEPAFASIDHYVAVLDHAIAAVTESSGLPPVLVCHSMGGLAARAWLRTSSVGRIHHIVTIASPHQGTWLARFSHTRNGGEMKIASDWLRQLQLDTQACESVFTCWYSNCDNVVFPSSMATLPGADNRFVHGLAHVDLAFHPEVMAATLAILEQP